MEKLGIENLKVAIVAAINLAERIENKPNKINVSKIALGWLMTLFAAGLMTILFIYVIPA